MYRIEKLDDTSRRVRWEPVSDARYVSEEAAVRARRALVEDAMREAAQRGAWKTPRFRVVRALPVVECAGLQ